MPKKSQAKFSKNSLVLILLGSLTWIITVFKSGQVYPYGVGFWGANAHDGLWHVSLANSLKKGSLEMPIFAGEQIKNYHIGYDLLLAAISKLTFIPVHQLYFQIFPIILSLSIGASVYLFVYKWTKSKNEAFWSLFFVYFAGSFGWVITLAKNSQLGGESIFWSQQAISTLINPPFALSIAILFFALTSMLNYLKTRNIKNTIITVILFSLLIQIKAYAGLLALTALFSASIFESLVKKTNKILRIFIPSLVLSIAIFLLLNPNAGSLIIWKPFWFLEQMMLLSDRVGWQRFGEAMVNYRLANNWIKFVPALIVSFNIFLFGNLGTRFISFFLIIYWLVNYKKLNSIQVILLTLAAAGIAVPMLFLQEGTPWNTIQFFYYTQVVLGIIAGITFSKITQFKKNIKIKNILIVSLIALTVPTTFASLKNVYLPGRPPSKLDIEELQALQFLKSQPNGAVLTYPHGYEPTVLSTQAPKSLVNYVSTAYVSAYSQKPVFLEDEINLTITNYAWENRRQEVVNFLETLDEEQAKNFLKENNISYIYWIKGQRAKLGEAQLGIERIYENELVDIYKVI